MKSIAAGIVLALAVAGLALLCAPEPSQNIGIEDRVETGDASLSRSNGVIELGAERFRRGGEDVQGGGSVYQTAVLENLTERVRILEERLAMLEGESAALLGQDESADLPELKQAQPTEPAEGATDSTPWFEDSSLEALGFRPSEIERIRDTWEYTVLTGMELETDRLRNGEKGWLPALRDQDLIAREAQEVLGAFGYDAMLYASGGKNRLILAELIDSSPGAAAGIESGDELISYDGQRIFSPFTLKRLMTSGDAGELIEVRLQRGGESVRVFMPRGPIGARLDAQSRPPIRE